MSTPSFAETTNLPSTRAFDALVVDDSDFDRQRIRRFSEKTNLPIRVHEVPSISAMQQAVASTRFDLILLDYQLADGDGLEALRVLRECNLQKETGVIMITGDERADVAASAFRNGCSDFVSKSAMCADVMKSAMLRTLNTVDEARYQQLAQDRLRQEVEGVVLASLSGPLAQQSMSELMRAAQLNAAADLKLSQQLEMSTFIEALDEDDEFRFRN